LKFVLATNKSSIVSDKNELGTFRRDYL